MKADILDLYFSLYVGGEISTHACYQKNGHNGRGRAGAIMGLRWYFVEPVALMFEFGAPPMGFTTIGVSFKL
ncbi:MAG: hypothetical protein SH857_05345 [Chitinophagales bacterium]|nr:hypothetical protein [Chitinophagales bacterium]